MAKILAEAAERRCFSLCRLPLESPRHEPAPFSPLDQCGKPFLRQEPRGPDLPEAVLLPLDEGNEAVALENDVLCQLRKRQNPDAGFRQAYKNFVHGGSAYIL